MGAPRGTVQERFERYVERTDTCWIWTGGRDRLGYGYFAVSTQRRDMAHRVAYELFVGPIPEGLVLDHFCCNPSCVNPEHLEAVTQGTNVIRSPISASGRNVRKIACPKGHAYDKLTRDGLRRCSVCDRESERRRNERRKAIRHAQRNAPAAPLARSTAGASTERTLPDDHSNHD